MKAIEIRYHGPTSTKGSRMSAFAEDLPTHYYPYDYAKTPSEQAVDVAKDYAARLDWNGDMITGSTRAGWVAVFVGSNYKPAE